MDSRQASIILFCTLKRTEEKKIRQIWAEKYQVGSFKHGVNFQVRLRDNINYLISYILKHSSKVLHSDEQTPGFLRFHAVIWSMGREKHVGINDYKRVRLFSVSRRLSQIMKLPSQNQEAVRVILGGDDPRPVYEKHDVNPYEEPGKYLAEIEENSKKVKQGVDFFCSLNFDIEE